MDHGIISVTFKSIGNNSSSVRYCVSPPLGIMTINKLLKSTKVVAAVTSRKNLQGHYHRRLWGIGTL